jgi:hypothetical protein
MRSYNEAKSRPVPKQVFVWHIKDGETVMLEGRNPGDTVAALSRLVPAPFRAHCAHGPGYGVRVA